MRKADIESAVEKICGPIAEALNTKLIDVEYKKEGNDFVLRVIIDKPEGVTIDDCENMSRALSDRLDEEDPIEGSYNLEVQSPGERTLRRDSEYEYFSGRDVEVKLYQASDGKKLYGGKLIGLDDGLVSIAADGGRVIGFPKEKIASCRLKIIF